MSKLNVEVVDMRGKVVKVIECASERAAERIERGMNMNLNHAAYFTRVVSAKLKGDADQALANKGAT